MAAPSGASIDVLNCGNFDWFRFVKSGRESSIVAEIVEVEENSTDYMQTLRRPPVITIHRSPAYAIYQLIHNIRVMMLLIDLSEYSVKTRKCEPDALKECVRHDEIGHVIEHSEVSTFIMQQLLPV
ncbi:unnamed protein product [Linum tenue]|uniref:Uncharacterized protein n=1 Tax=Linum tenue TaxID=586396 RepID=A0AAV0K0P1_9ROSI|nr:unnamed protein product [Linum tenue]